MSCCGALSPLDRLLASPLARAGGATLVRLLDEASVAALHAEALACHPTGRESFVPEPDAAERGGAPDRHLESAVGGPLLDSLYAAPELPETLYDLTGVRWRPSGGQATYSYYCRPGHHLGIHRDVDACDLAVIVCLADDRAPVAGDDEAAGSLVLYPSRSNGPLQAIRDDPVTGAVAVRSRPGDAAVILGGMVPHRLHPVGARHVRIVAPLCFTPA